MPPRVLLLTVVVAAALAAPIAHADIYWASTAPTNAIGRAADDGTCVNKQFITAASDPTGVAVNGQHVFWTNEATKSIGRADIDGRNANQTFMTRPDVPRYIAISGTRIYWTEEGHIFRANLDGSGVESIVDTYAAAIAADAGHVYWLIGTSLGRANLDGSDPEPDWVTINAPNGISLAVGNGYLYFPTFEDTMDGQIHTMSRVPTSGGSPEVVIPYNDTPGLENRSAHGVAVSPSFLYWGDNIDTISRSGLTGGSPVANFISGPANTYELDWVNSAAACASPTVSPDPDPSVSPDPSATPDPKKHATALQLMCTYTALTGQDRCTATVGDADAKPTTPTGKVVFTAAKGGFQLGNACTLSASPSAPTAPSCSVVYLPPGGTSALPTMTASYEGDATHNPSSGSTKLLAAGGPTNYGSATGSGGNFPGQLTITTNVPADGSDVTACAATGGKTGAKASQVPISGPSLDQAIKVLGASVPDAQAQAKGDLVKLTAITKGLADDLKFAIATAKLSQELGKDTNGSPLTPEAIKQLGDSISKGQSELDKISGQLGKCLFPAGGGSQRSLATIAKKKKRKVRAVKLGFTRRSGLKRGTVKVKLRLSKKAVRKAAKGRKKVQVLLLVTTYSPSPGVKRGVPSLTVKTLTLKKGKR